MLGVILAKPGKSGDYERVTIDAWIIGEIAEVQERLGVEKTFKDKETGEMKTRKVDQVRFKFSLENYEYPHYSRWMTLSTNENSNLYKKYIQSLFGSKFPPDTLLDIDRLTGLKCKTMWDETPTKQGGIFQFVGKIRLLNPDDVNNINLVIDDTEHTDFVEELEKGLPENGQETPF